MGTAHYFNGSNAYAVISPFTVYGWSEITITEWLYLPRPKVSSNYGISNVIGDWSTDGPSTLLNSANANYYSWLNVLWRARTSSGTKADYYYNIVAYTNQWILLTRRFTSSREYSVYVNGQKMYSATVPSDYKTVLEWNPDTATYPNRYKRFVLGANWDLGYPMDMYQAMLLIYNRALSDTEIQQIYNTPNNPPTNGLVLWFDNPDFTNDCCKAIWRDKSGNGNNGKLYNVQMAYY
jgi:hypothetical protein